MKYNKKKELNILKFQIEFYYENSRNQICTIIILLVCLFFF